MAWQLKRCLSCFNRVAARPHRPRSRVIRALMEAAGIPVPQEVEKPKVKRGKTSSTSSSDESETEADASDESVEREAEEPVATKRPMDTKKETNSPSLSTTSGTGQSSSSGSLD